jgi:hypothetical protein
VLCSTASAHFVHAAGHPGAMSFVFQSVGGVGHVGHTWGRGGGFAKRGRPTLAWAVT